MKARLEFDLSDEDDVIKHKMMLKASDMYSALWSFGEELRLIYREKKTVENPVEHLFDFWFNTLENCCINLEDLDH